jgi:hypothetical protein
MFKLVIADQDDATIVACKRTHVIMGLWHTQAICHSVASAGHDAIGEFGREVKNAIRVRSQFAQQVGVRPFRRRECRRTGSDGEALQESAAIYGHDADSPLPDDKQAVAVL